MKIGIVGASGVVGKELLDILLADGYYDLKLCAGKAIIGKKLLFDIDDTPISFVFKKLEESFFDELDVAFFCTDNDLSKEWIPIALKHNVYVIDNSSYFRMDESVPLIIPEINGQLVGTSKLITNPNCCTAILCMILHPLTELSSIKRVDVLTYQEFGESGVFTSEIYDKFFPHNTSIDPKTGYNGEELKIIKETQKIMGHDIKVSATYIRLPTVRGHSESIKIVFTEPTSEDEIRTVLGGCNGIKVFDDDREENKFPDRGLVIHKNDILVGRIRKDYHDETNTVFHMFICSNQLSKGALNAYQIFRRYENYLGEMLHI